jgi:hypothetical protein
LFQDDEYRLASLRTFLSDATLEFIDNLSMSPESDLIDSIMSALKGFFCGGSRPNVVRQRRNFNLRQQVKTLPSLSSTVE